MDVAAMAPTLDAVIVRWCDWYSWTQGQDDDPDYNTRLRQFRAHGVPSTGYLFARPEMAPPLVQIDTWAARTETAFDFPPMLDIENPTPKPGQPALLRGQAMADWVEAALERMFQIWGMPPMFYFSNHLEAKLGITRPNAQHILMVPGYPFKDDPPVRYPEGRSEQWVLAAGGPSGYQDYLPSLYANVAVGLWQYTSTAHIAGTSNTVDVSEAYPAFLRWFDQTPPPDPGRIADLIAILRGTVPLVIAGRKAEPIAADALEKLRGLISPAAADVLVATLSSDNDG